MKRALFVLVIGLVAAATASAHTYPSRRSIAVQAEKDAIVVLAVWTAPADDVAAVFELGAAMSGTAKNESQREEKTKAALEAQLAARAIGPIELSLDGAPLEPASVSTRLIEDPPGSGRRGVAVLVEAPIPAGAHAVEVSLGPTGESTRMSFVDRSNGAVTTSGRIPAGGIVPSGTRFRIHWREP